MADYHSPTVVSPSIPTADMMALEILLLARIFDETVEEQQSYLHSWCGPCDTFGVDADELRDAWEASRDSDSSISTYVQKSLEEYAVIPDRDRPDDIDLNLTGPGQEWSTLLQGIVRRSQTLDEIVVTTSFTWTKMRPDGFGGSIMRITAHDIQYASTVEMLERMRDAPATPTATDRHDDHETRGRIEVIADAAGWDSFTVLLLIARWLGQSRSPEALIDFLKGLADDDNAGQET